MPEIYKDQLPYLALLATVLAEARPLTYPPKFRGISNERFLSFAKEMQGPLSLSFVNTLLDQTETDFTAFLQQSGTACFMLPKRFPTEEPQIILCVDDPEKMLDFLSQKSEKIALLPSEKHRKTLWSETEKNILSLLEAARTGTLETTPWTEEIGVEQKNSAVTWTGKAASWVTHSTALSIPS